MTLDEFEDYFRELINSDSDFKGETPKSLKAIRQNFNRGKLSYGKMFELIGKAGGDVTISVNEK
jgi:hypothetical protein